MKNLNTLATAKLPIALAVLLFSIGCGEEKNSRVAFMRSMHSAVIMYASDNKGILPSATNGVGSPLQLLYPVYCPSGKELAGLSGDIQKTVDTLKHGRPLTDLFTSWVYVSGLKDTDNPNIAVLWESQTGFLANGKPGTRGVRPVILLSGDITNISEADWKGFLKVQERLRLEQK